jgi:hypothetical protein
MYYSYVEIEYVATSFSARTDLALKLLMSIKKNFNQELFDYLGEMDDNMRDIHYLLMSIKLFQSRII